MRRVFVPAMHKVPTGPPEEVGGPTLISPEAYNSVGIPSSSRGRQVVLFFLERQAPSLGWLPLLGGLLVHAGLLQTFFLLRAAFSFFRIEPAFGQVIFV